MPNQKVEMTPMMEETTRFFRKKKPLHHWTLSGETAFQMIGTTKQTIKPKPNDHRKTDQARMRSPRVYWWSMPSMRRRKNVFAVIRSGACTASPLAR